VSDADLQSESLEARPCSAADLPQLRATWPFSADVHERHFAGQLSGIQTLVVAWMHGQTGGEAVGTCLMRTSERLARLRGARWLGLGVGVDNPKAAALYERLGYVRTGIVARSEYGFVDDNRVEQHAVEWDEYMVMDVEVASASPLKDREGSC
jgi:hypothetical protein